MSVYGQPAGPPPAPSDRWRIIDMAGRILSSGNDPAWAFGWIADVVEHGLETVAVVPPDVSVGEALADLADIGR